MSPNAKFPPTNGYEQQTGSDLAEKLAVSVNEYERKVVGMQKSCS